MMTALLALVIASEPTGLDLLNQSATLRSDQWAQIANAAIALGESKACAFIIEKSVPPRGTSSFGRENIRACHLLRILYSSKTSGPLRAPMLGGLSLPRHSMPLSSYPHYPMLVENRVIFELASGYMLAGGPGESAAGYLTYLKSNGKFHGTRFPVPNRKMAVEALDKFFNSERWCDMRWSYRSQNESYSISPGFVVNYLYEQLPL